MIVSHRHRFIFIKSKKTAGTSIEIFLAGLCGPKDIVTPIGRADKDRRHTARNHAGYFNHILPGAIQQRLGRTRFDAYFKFTAVRNPWDKIVSLWWFPTRDGSAKPPFKQWLKQEVQAGTLHLHRLLPYCKAGGQWVLDGFVRYERLLPDLERTLVQMGVRGNTDNFPRAKTQYRKDKAPYQEYYDKETREIVARLFEKDIERFGYTFES